MGVGLKNLYRICRDYYLTKRCINSGEHRLDFVAAEIIRLTHSIEKGLSIQSPRLGFGHEKLENLMQYIDVLRDSTFLYHQEAIKMAVASIGEYVSYHNEHNYSDNMIKALSDYIKPYYIDANYGGIIHVDSSELRFETTEIERLFFTRHSIRDFEPTRVDEERLKKALILAQNAPSACNRQAYRAYVLSEEKSRTYADVLDGVGGFEKSVNRFILITSKRSAYRTDEPNQHIVSASIFAAYLSLTLHLYGLGACLVQRPLIWNKEQARLLESYGIPNDEQLICLLAVGNLKDSFDVPISHRLSEQVVFRFVK